MWLVAAAVLMALAVVVRLLVPRSSRAGPQRGAEGPATRRHPGSRTARGARSRAFGKQRMAGVLAGIACCVLVGPPVGIVPGVALAVGVTIGLGRLETAAQRAERVALAADAPLLADLLAAALAAGVPLEQATPVVARAVGGPLQRRLLQVDARVRLGQSAAGAWAELGTEPGPAAIVATVTRSARTGAPLAQLLAAAASDLRQSARTTARGEIRAASVRAVLPLGLCLLPAFVLLGIVPIVGGLLQSL